MRFTQELSADDDNGSAETSTMSFLRSKVASLGALSGLITGQRRAMGNIFGTASGDADLRPATWSGLVASPCP